MPTLLMIQASARSQGSHSREVAEHLITRWKTAHPNGTVIERDLAKQPIPHISEDTITGFFTPEDALTDTLKAANALSDQLIAEIDAADTVVISTPMYNFNVPSALKAWIDQVSRVNKTFSYDPEQGFAGLIQGKKVYVIAATGAVFSDPALADMDFLHGYLNAMLGFLGMPIDEYWLVEGASADPDTLINSKQAAVNHINQLWG